MRIRSQARGWWDHPRGCGEKNNRPPWLGRAAGSSPRVRGKAWHPLHILKSLGIIPAGAGKSPASAGSGSVSWDHPRGCGEKRPFCRLKSRKGGSSPRVRGKESAKSCSGSSVGSSPRVRGKANGRSSMLLAFGIIPAGAGKSGGDESGDVAKGDHPRGCGEKDHAGYPKNTRAGSSPRVRGKVPTPCPSPTRRRIIPAGAEKRQSRRAPRSAPRDHPRGCGEKQTCPPTLTPSLGSSPRVRGKVDITIKAVEAVGIIPAGAGKSISRFSRQN